MENNKPALFSDIRIKQLTTEMGALGFGIYMMLSEVISENGDLGFDCSKLESIAKYYCASPSDFKKVAYCYDLFIKENNFLKFK